MEQVGVLPNRWNGPIKREHLSEQRHAWSRPGEKNKAHQEHLLQYDTLTADLETVSLQHAESIDIDKALQEKIKALRSHQDTSSKQEIKMLQKQAESEKEERRALRNERTGIKKMMQEVKDSGLNGSRVNHHRPMFSTPQAVPKLAADSPAPHSSIEKTLANVNEHLPGMFTLLRNSIFKNSTSRLFSTTSTR